ncbi:MAG: glycosyltransferase family 4 protein [Gammaproteobacteria bacterium]
MLRKKICVVIPTHWSWVLGGAEYQVSLITEHLVTDDRFDVTVLTRNVDSSFSSDDYIIKKIRPGRFFSRYSKAFDGKNLLAALNDIRPDIIYQRSGSAYTGICAWYAHRNHIPMVWHISHDMDVTPKMGTKKFPFELIEKKCLEYGIRHTTHIIAQTDTQAGLLKKNYGRTANQIIRNFHPFPAADEPSNKGGKIKIVWIANFKPMKQPELFVRLAKELENVIDVQFVMIGKIGNHKQYGQLLETINTIKSLDYIGEQPQEKVNKILSESHLLINTSKLEGFSNTFIQAWMRGVPVITITVDPDAVIKNNEIGVCTGSYEKLKDTVINLVRSPERLVYMGQKGKQYADENHSMKNIDKIHETLRLLSTTGNAINTD